MKISILLLTILAAFLLPACGEQATAPALKVAGQPTFVLIYTEN